MLHQKRWARLVLLTGMVFLLSFSGVSAAAGSAIWVHSADNSGWSGFMQRIMQADYRMQMSSGAPYWSTLMLPVDESAATSGQSSYMGMPAFGFCPVPGQCYMVLVQSPMGSGTSANCPPAPIPAQPLPNQQGKPNSLW